MEKETEIKGITNIEIAEHPPTWIKAADIAFIRNNDAIKDVIDFFVVYSPCANVSARGMDLTQYYWKEKNPTKGKYLYNKILSTAGLVENETLFFSESLSNTEELFARARMGKDFCQAYTDNRVALVSNGNLIMSIFRAIRNCLAHCRFTIILDYEDPIIAMENGEPIGKEKEGKQFQVKARMLLKLSTLKEWIRIVKEDHAKADEEELIYEKEVEKSLLEAIRNENYSNTDDLISKINYSKNDVKDAKKKLISRDIIKYSRKEKRWIILSEV